MRGPSFEGASLRPLLWLSLTGVWLLYLVYPIGEFTGGHHSPAQVAGGVLVLAVFVALYLVLWRRPLALSDAERMAGCAALTALSLLSVWLFRLPDALGGLVYVGPVLGFVHDRRWAAVGMVAVGAIMVVEWRALALPLSLVWTLMVPFVAATLAMLAWAAVWRMGMRLRLAAVKLREMAVLDERLALSRDMHDVVGHSLSALAVRAELAAEQAREVAPESAAEMRQVAAMAREALKDVRRMVSRWRVVSLGGEWADARATLQAAGIETEDSGTDITVPPELDRGLGFFVREGATNILRHSSATRCRLTVRVSGEGDRLLVELTDNGAARGHTGAGGAGLSGLRERFLPLGGHLAADPTPTGFKLTVEVPWSGA